MKKGVSVILCTYNGRKRLDETLNHLVKQVFHIPCEIVFVDNASDDDTLDYVKSWWRKYGNNDIEFRSFYQKILGKSYAQDLGYEKAQYEYLLVCDDDNWLSNNYIQTAFNIMESDINIGALGGWCEAEFGKDKPYWFDEFSRFYAVSKQGEGSEDITNKKGCLYGAGMVIRKSHWLELKSLGFKHQLTCRKGNKLSSGGDTEYCFALRLLGYKIRFDERLYFKHFMDSKRLNLTYISKLRKEMTESNFILFPYHEFFGNNSHSKSSLRKNALVQIRKHGLVSGINLIFGNYSKRENAKNFFRLIKMKIFNYELYEKSKTSILKWKPDLINE